MIIDHYYKFIFVHIPKTAGCSIEKAISQYVVDGEIHSEGELKHEPFSDIVIRFSAIDWNKYIRFVVIRNPWEMIHSDWHFSLIHIKRLSIIKENPRLRKWANDLEEISKYRSFNEFVREKYLKKRKGIWRHYCQDENGFDLQSHVLRFENLDEDFHEICKKIGFENIPKLEKINVCYNRPHYTEEYTQVLADSVGEYVKYESDRFGYKYGQ